MKSKQMELKDILTISIATLIVLVVAHIAVFWVVRTLYPPSPVVPAAPVVSVPVAPPVFTQPPVTEQQDVHIPTYQAPSLPEVPQQEGSTSLADLQESPVQRDPRMAAS
jgi:hypothetical protein